MATRESVREWLSVWRMWALWQIVFICGSRGESFVKVVQNISPMSWAIIWCPQPSYWQLSLFQASAADTAWITLLRGSSLKVRVICAFASLLRRSQSLIFSIYAACALAASLPIPVIRIYEGHCSFPSAILSNPHISRTVQIQYFHIWKLVPFSSSIGMS